MLNVVFVLPEGTVRTVQAHAGDSVMRAALAAGIDGIEGTCGGGLSCATCHVQVDAAWADRLPAPEAGELDLLDFTEAPRTPASRLGCQIVLDEGLDGLVLAIPALR